MSKPINGREWDNDDIRDAQDVLPEWAEFGAVSSGNRLEIDMGEMLSEREINPKIVEVKNALREAGVEVDSVALKAGYSGAITPRLLLTVWMGEEP